MIKLPWQQHFNEQLQGLTEEFRTSGSSLSLLAYAFQKMRLETEEYFIWAQNYYGLPLLQAQFFLETPLSQEMFAKWATHYRWSAECLPVAEWDGALIVACLQPPQDFPLSPPTSLVLATPEDLEKAWLKFIDSSSLHITTSSLAAPPIPNVESKAFSPEDLFGLNDPSSSESDENISEEGSEEVEVADEFGSLSLEPFDTAPSLVKLQKVETPSARVQSETLTPKPAMAATVPPATKVVLEKKPEESIDEKTIPSISILKKDEVSANPASPFPTPSKSLQPMPPPPLKSKEEFEKNRVVIKNKNEVKPSKPSLEKSEKPLAIPVVPAAPLPVPNIGEHTESQIASQGTGSFLSGKLKSSSSGVFPLEKIKKKNAALMAEKIKKTLADMHTHFQKAMILTVDEEETQVMAFAWDGTFSNIPDTAAKIPLKTPSIFNIVSSTQKPFHGYVSLNQINEKFFGDWNHGNIPDHITITPIISHDKVIGMMIGFADKSAYNKMSLSWAERLSNEFLVDLAS